MKSWKANKSFIIVFPMGSRKTYKNFPLFAVKIKDKLIVWSQNSCTLERIAMNHCARRAGINFMDIKSAERTGRYYIIVEDPKFVDKFIKWLEK